jgi:hypothetical protein
MANQEEMNFDQQKEIKVDEISITFDYTQTLLRHVDRLNSTIPSAAFSGGFIDKYKVLGCYFQARLLHSMIDAAVPQTEPYREKANPLKSKLKKDSVYLLNADKFSALEYFETLLLYVDVSYSQFKWLGLLPHMKGKPYFPKPEENKMPYAKDWDK